ncbi:hypothetical protein BEH_11635 [Priestia filamentosa]|uniref:Uncharacterized protein n=1 Tax=Priestia filamentosa TaxID=1402861 RepID=A0A0H4KF11_9BACI|nr:hypothetical protein [Priestia filamentosa]AKO92687.1 hypothetical protein BEH_11635 [Priestia filamentosa]
MSAPIKECPHCHSKEGYYSKERVYGSVNWKYNFDGSEADNSAAYDYLTTKSGKCAYCRACDKKLFNMSEAEGNHEGTQTYCR